MLHGCWEHRTGSCPVLVLCGVSMGYCHVLRSIHLDQYSMNNTKWNLSDVHYKLIYKDPYLRSSNWWSTCIAAMSGCHSGTYPIMSLLDWLLSSIALMRWSDWMLSCMLLLHIGFIISPIVWIWWYHHWVRKLFTPFGSYTIFLNQRWLNVIIARI